MVPSSRESGLIKKKWRGHLAEHCKISGGASLRKEKIRGRYIEWKGKLGSLQLLLLKRPTLLFRTHEGYLPTNRELVPITFRNKFICEGAH